MSTLSESAKVEVSKIVEDEVQRAVKDRLKQIKSKIYWGVGGASLVIFALGIDLFFTDQFVRQSLSNAFLVEKTAEDIIDKKLEDLFTNSKFSTGTYAINQSLKLSCQKSGFSFTFHADPGEDDVSIFLMVTYPNSMHNTIMLEPSIDSYPLGQMKSTVIDRQFTPIHQYFFSKEATAAIKKSRNFGVGSSIHHLNVALSTTDDDSLEPSCITYGNAEVRLLIKTAGDPREKLYN